jgi:hypothetical protein
MSTAAGRDPLGPTPYDHRAWIMMMAEELALSLVPEGEFVPEDVIRRLDILEIEVSNALGISIDDEGPPL